MTQPYLDFHTDKTTGKITEYSLHGLSKDHVESLYIATFLAHLSFKKFTGSVFSMFPKNAHVTKPNYQKIIFELNRILAASVKVHVIDPSNYSKN